jgi:hypothetical protein
VCSNCGITFKKYGRIPGGIVLHMETQVPKKEIASWCLPRLKRTRPLLDTTLTLLGSIANGLPKTVMTSSNCPKWVNEQNR